MQAILFVELLSGIGDLVIALPAIQALARSHPDARLTVLTFEPGGELLEADPLIARVVYAKSPPRQAVTDILARERFDLVVSDTAYDGIADIVEGSGAPRVVSNLWRSPPPDRRVGDRFLDILLAEGLIAPGAVAPPSIQLTGQERDEAERALGPSRPLVFLYPDVSMRIKRWPAANFAALGHALRERCDADVVVPVGSDPEGAAQIAASIGGPSRVWPRGPLRKLTAALAAADLVVAADTGPAHIAAALGVPTITLFGPTWHERYGQPPPHRNIQGHPTCPEREIGNFTEQRCWYGGTCPLGPWQTCMETISPTDVLAVAESILAGGTGQARGADTIPRQARRASGARR